MDYVAMIIDIEKSKTYHTYDRIEMQYFMKDCIRNLNYIFRKKTVFEVMFSAGDEVQGLFSDVPSALMYFRLLELLMKPIKLRAGLGVGKWNIKIETGNSVQQDGITYHRARNAIEQVKEMKLHNLRICSDISEQTIEGAILNQLLNAALPLKNQQIYMQNIVQVILELLYPMVVDREIVCDYDAIKELISRKFEYKLGAKNRGNYHPRNIAMESEYLEDNQMYVIKPLYIDGELKELEDVIIEKNTALSISRVLGCSRQNVDNIMRRGHVNKIRELDYVALQMAKRLYGGK